MTPQLYAICTILVCLVCFVPMLAFIYKVDAENQDKYIKSRDDLDDE